MGNTTRDAAASEIIGGAVSDVTESELAYLQKRKAELEGCDGSEPLLVEQVLSAEFNVRRLKKKQQGLLNLSDRTADEVEFREKALKSIARDIEDAMALYHSGMDGLGIRKQKKHAANTSPLSELWLRYCRVIAAKDRRGEEVGEPSKESLELAEKKAAETGLKHSYKIKGALPKETRKKAIAAVQYPTNIDEKKNVISLGVMLDDFLHDPILAAQCIFAEVLIKPPEPPFTPIQELRIFGMWGYKYFVDSSGFGLGKTFCAALVTALRAVLMADRHIGIVSDTFPQGKLFFEQYFDPWVEKCPIFTSQIKLSTKGGFNVIHNDDGFIMNFKNGSSIKALPPNFLNDAKRLKSESWTDRIGDEWTAWPNLGKSLPIVEGRVRRPVGDGYDVKNPIFTLHHASLGAADFTWRGCYDVIKQYQQRVFSGDARYCVQSFSYLDLPKKWRQIKYGIDEDNLENMRDRMTKDEYERLVLALWKNDSTGYYLASEIMACRG